MRIEKNQMIKEERVIRHIGCTQSSGDMPYVISQYETTDGKPQCNGCFGRPTKRDYNSF